MRARGQTAASLPRSTRLYMFFSWHVLSGGGGGGGGGALGFRTDIEFCCLLYHGPARIQTYYSLVLCDSLARAIPPHCCVCSVSFSPVHIYLRLHVRACTPTCRVVQPGIIASLVMVVWPYICISSSCLFLFLCLCVTRPAP